MPLSQNEHTRVKQFRLGEIPSYEVLADDFDRIEEVAQDVGLAFHFAIFCLSVAVTLSVTLVTVPVDNLIVKVIFVAVIFVGFVLGLYFLITALSQRDRLAKMMQKIRARQVAPLGEKDGEIGPLESQQLPAETADASGPNVGEET